MALGDVCQYGASNLQDRVELIRPHMTAAMSEVFVLAILAAGFVCMIGWAIDNQKYATRVTTGGAAAMMMLLITFLLMFMWSTYSSC